MIGLKVVIMPSFKWIAGLASEPSNGKDCGSFILHFPDQEDQLTFVRQYSNPPEEFQVQLVQPWSALSYLWASLAYQPSVRARMCVLSHRYLPLPQGVSR
jgi:hypothetical protein